MLKRLMKRNAGSREWNREHEFAWAGQCDAIESGLSPFQLMCEAAVVSALSGVGVVLIERTVEGTQESYVKARLAGMDWRLWIYSNGAEVSSESSTLVRMEEWDAKTPAEFIAAFIDKTVVGLRESGERSD